MAGAAVAAKIIGSILMAGGPAAATGAQTSQSSGAKAESKLQQKIMEHAFNKQMVFENQLRTAEKRKAGDIEKQSASLIQGQKGQQAAATSVSQTQGILDRLNRNPRARQLTVQSLKRT
jgi:hypothetical protein